MPQSKNRTSKFLDPEDFSSSECLFICFSIFESLGYPGWNEAMSVLNNKDTIIKFLRLFGGATIKVPSIDTFRISLLASAYIYMELFHCNDPFISKTKKAWSLSDVEKELNLAPEDKARIEEIYNHYIKYMDNQGYPLDKLYPLTTQMAKKRFKKVRDNKGQ